MYLFRKFLLQQVKLNLYIFGSFAFLIDFCNAHFKIHAGLQCPQNLIRRTEYALEQLKFLRQQFIDTFVSGVFLIQEINDNDIIFLPISVATSNTLLNTLRIPRQIVVDHKAAELQIDTLCGGFCSNQDAGTVTEFLNHGSFHVRLFGTGNQTIVFMAFLPLGINALGSFIVIQTIQKDHLPFISMVGQKIEQIGLSSSGFGKYYSFLLSPKFLHFLESLL